MNYRTFMINGTSILSIFLFLITFTSCTAIGPGTVSRDRFNYTTALSDSWKKQMLLNLVMLRYGDAPVFLDVASIINQYSVETELNANLAWSSPPSEHSQELGGNIIYTDKPTITYTPIGGEKMARSLMTPIPTLSILHLMEAGYPIGLVFRFTLHSINGVQNRYGGTSRERQADPEFYILIEKLEKIQRSGAVGIRVRTTEEKSMVMLLFNPTSDPEIKHDIREVRNILGLDPAAQEFWIHFGASAFAKDEIAILPRSLLEILVDLAANIEVPAKHIGEQRVNPTFVETTADGSVVAPLIRIYSSTAQNEDAFVSVPYRNHWFWIDDRDLPSKKIFSFLMFLFSLTETGGVGGAPIVTIPAG